MSFLLSHCPAPRELFTGEVAFQALHYGQFFETVVLRGLRPEVPGHMPDDYQLLMERCWASEPGDRPTVTLLLECLELMIGEAPPGLDTCLTQQPCSLPCRPPCCHTQLCHTVSQYQCLSAASLDLWHQSQTLLFPLSVLFSCCSVWLCCAADRWDALKQAGAQGQHGWGSAGLDASESIHSL